MTLIERLWNRIRPNHWQDLAEDDVAWYALHGRAWWNLWQTEWCLYRPSAWPATFMFEITRWPGRPGWKLALGVVVASLYVSYRDQDEWGNGYGIKIHNRMLWWSFGHNDIEWSSSDSRWIRGSFDPLEFLLGKHQVEFTTLEEREVLIPMPEGCYHGKATMKLRRDYRARFPRLTTHYSRQPWVDVDAGIPFDGKGENGWDCGGDALYGTGAGNSIEEAIGYVVARALESRKRYGASFAKQAGELPDDARIAPRETLRAGKRS
jgi:hypothetical protein